MQTSSVLCLWRNSKAPQHFRSGVSLHSHTNESRETLQFLAMLGDRYGFMRRLMRRLEHRSEANHGVRVDYARSYWTPPMPPKLALDLESGQIERLGLSPLVSLTDHDSIRGPLLLQTLGGAHRIPISFEWTVPYGPQSFHLGIHNLPAGSASEWMEALAGYTAHPSNTRLQEILAALHADPRILVIFNHPRWDLYRVGEEAQLCLLDNFLREHRSWIHAIELNGLRNWKENAEVLCLARKWDMVLISGGDRHGVEPNANINLTNATSFEEFVDEVRRHRQSTILFLPQYTNPWKHRILQSAIDAVRTYPDFPAGSQFWDERVYHPDRHGVSQSLRALWPDGNPPRSMRWSIGLVQMMGRTAAVSGSLRGAWRDTPELALFLEEPDL